MNAVHSTGAKEVRAERIREILADYILPVPDGLEHQVRAYMGLLALWQRKLPLTAIQDPEEIVRLHFGESMFALSLVSGTMHGRLADVGSGAGFPGLPLRLAEPGLSVIQIEPNKKKCAFLHEVVRSLRLSGIEIVSSPFESTEIESASLSFVTCRALGRYAAVARWAKDKLKPHGSLLLWLGRQDVVKISALPEWKWGKASQIPGSRARFIFRGVPME